jgi:hypothetical protein
MATTLHNPTTHPADRLGQQLRKSRGFLLHPDNADCIA